MPMSDIYMGGITWVHASRLKFGTDTRVMSRRQRCAIEGAPPGKACVHACKSRAVHQAEFFTEHQFVHRVIPEQKMDCMFHFT